MTIVRHSGQTNCDLNAAASEYIICRDKRLYTAHGPVNVASLLFFRAIRWDHLNHVGGGGGGVYFDQLSESRDYRLYSK